MKNIFDASFANFLFAFIALSASALLIMGSGTIGTKTFSKKVEPEKTIILVHGAFTDGSSWNKVIPLIQKEGHKVIAVQNTLTSLEDDVAYVNHAIEEATGEVILVGHSWAGAVITQAGGHKKVSSLVYVSAFAPDEDESLQDILMDAHAIRKIPNAPGFANPIADKNGFLRLSEETMINHFAQDLPQREARLLAATQGRLHVDALTDKVTYAGWKTKPSYFLISEKDQMIAPRLLTEMARDIDATVINVNSGHLPMLSKPKKVADVILQAARHQY